MASDRDGLAVSVQGLSAGYRGDRIIREIDVAVPERDIVGLVGPNGAGKSTLLRTVFGKARVVEGRVEIFGQDCTAMSSADRVKGGVAFVEQGARVFPTLSVTDCLRVAWLPASAQKFADSLELVLEKFPPLRSRLRLQAGSLSGGERQMLAIGMALIQRPRLILLDEPSIGLAPKVVAEVMESIAAVRDSMGVTILIAEQNVRALLPIVSTLHVLKAGVLRERTEPAALRQDDDIRRLLL